MHGTTAVMVAFFTSALTAAGTIYVNERFGIIPARSQAAPEAVVPELAGLLENDARANAGIAHVALLVAGREPNADAKPGAVIRQSVAVGQHVPRDYPVSIVLAEEVLKVPSLAGLTVAQATERVEAKGYHLQVGATVPDDNVAVGLVVEQAPKADMAQGKGGTVTVTVSGGPGEIEVPKVIGVGLTKAKTDLEKLGAKVTVNWVAMAETPTYVVLNQKPAGGTKVKPGSEILLTVCR